MDDITTLRAAATVLSFLCFMGILVWVLDRKKTAALKKRPNCPFWMSKDCHE